MEQKIIAGGGMKHTHASMAELIVNLEQELEKLKKQSRTNWKKIWEIKDRIDTLRNQLRIRQD
jgi:predicted  nucleic acid-binding Zn-ribbon protein